MTIMRRRDDALHDGTRERTDRARACGPRGELKLQYISVSEDSFEQVSQAAQYRTAIDKT